MSESNSTNSPTPPNPTSPSSSNQPFLRYDEYWLHKGREIIDNSLEVLNKRLESLNKYLNYLIGGTFITSTSLATYLQSPKIGVYGLIAISIIAVAIAKFYINIKGTTPVSKTVDMRSPHQINEHYADVITTLKKQVNEASGVVGAATFIALLFMPIAVYFHNCEEEVDTPNTYLSISTESNRLILKGALENAERVGVILHGKDAKKKPKNPIYTDYILQNPGQLDAEMDLSGLGIVLESLDIIYSVGKKRTKITHSILPVTANTKSDSNNTATDTETN